MAKPSFQSVLPSSELPAAGDEPQIRRVRVGRTSVLVSRLADGVVVAFGATCPHQDTPLEAATFWDGHLRCALHNYLYDPRTGENVLPRRDARPENLWKLKPGYLPTYRVEEHDGWIWVADQPDAPPPGYDPSLETRPSKPTRSEPLPLPPPAPVGPVEHPSEEISVLVGETFELFLPTTFRPGYMWRVEVPAGLASLGERFLPGEQARHLINLVAQAPGEATVRCAYARPWEATPAEVRNIVVRVNDRPAP